MPNQLPPTSDFTPEVGTLVLEDQSLRYGFVQLPKQILWARNISRDAKMLYAVLLGYAWQEDQCYPGYPRLCADMGASENMVRKYMRELEAVGLLRQKRRGQGRTNLYTLPDIRTAKIEVQEPHFSAAPEPAKTEGEVETVNQKTDRYPSNLRKVNIQEKLRPEPTRNRNSVAAGAATDAKARIRAKVARVRQSRGPSNGFVRPGVVLGDKRAEKLDGHSTSGRAYDEARQVLVSYMTDLARELGDQAELTSTTSRAYNLMQRSGLDLDQFISKIYIAKAKTQERTASITTRGGQTDAWGEKRKTKMPYFFSVLEDVLGLKETKDPRPNGRTQTRQTG